MAIWTLQALRRRIAGSGFLNDMVVSAATNGTTTTVVDTTLPQGDGFFTNATVVMTSGANSGLSRTVNSWVQSTGTLTLSKAFNSAVVAGDTYELHRLFTPADKNAAINNAIRLAKQRWPRHIADMSLTQTEDVYRHEITNLAVPIDPDLGVDSVQYEMPGLLTGEEWPFLPESDWKIVYEDGKTYLQLISGPMYVGYKWRLNYRVPPAVLGSDSAALVPDDNSLAEYVCAMATSLLCGDRSLFEREDTVKGPWIVRAADWREIANRMLIQDRAHKMVGKVIMSKSSSFAPDSWRQSTPPTRMRLD